MKSIEYSKFASFTIVVSQFLSGLIAIASFVTGTMALFQSPLKGAMSIALGIVFTGLFFPEFRTCLFRLMNLSKVTTLLVSNNYPRI